MQIGEFAKVCRTRISVLRHYDKQGLLTPAYIDRFTGYRYYTEDQIAVFVRIAALKQAGFSLTEIREILERTHSDDEIFALFERKKTALLGTLQHLEEAKRMLQEEHKIMTITFRETAEGLLASSETADRTDFSDLCERTETALSAKGYQRISTYRALGEPTGNEVRAACLVVKLHEDMTQTWEDIALPFEDDPTIVGQWEIIGTYAVREDFLAGRLCDHRWWGDSIKILHFLPGGERYWCYGWTRGKILFSNGDGRYVNPYTVQEHDGQRHMLVEWKSYQYSHGGKPIILVLRQMDHVARTKYEIARKDDVDLAYLPDTRVLGAWRRFGKCRTVESFDPARARSENGFFNRIDFRDGGHCSLTFGERTVTQEWTRGLVLNKASFTASVYELLTVDGCDYLLVQWKNGDYIWGGMEPNYVVFVREE